MTETPREQADMLYNFAVWMLGSREEAASTVPAVLRAYPGLGFDGWLGRICRGTFGNARARSNTAMQLQRLDEVLRTDLTIPVTLDDPLVGGDVRRLRVLQFEVMRACVWATVRALSPTPRAVLLLASLQGYSHARISATCELPVDRVREAHRRAEQTLHGYLGARCGRLDRRNICQCHARVGVALAREFIRWPEHGEHSEAAEPTARDDLGALVASASKFRPGRQLCAILAGMIAG